ncbi:MAG: hypothetical protein AB2A00_29895 [Myxococcota bacterium]
MAVSKMVINRQKSSNSVQAANSTHAPRIAAGVAARFGAELEGPVTTLLTKMRETLAADTTTMVAADDAHERELGDDAGPRTKRDESAVAVRAVLVRMKEVLTPVMGQSYVAQLGLAGETPEDPVAVERVATQVHEGLKSVPPPAPLVEEFTFNPEKYRAQIALKLPELSQALKDVSREGKEADDTLNRKNKAIASYDATFSQVANLTSALLEFIGEKDLAGKVRPSSRRPGQTTEVANEELIPG